MKRMMASAAAIALGLGAAHAQSTEMSEYDTDESGTISLDEFTAYSEQNENVGDHFSRYDEDASGTLSVEEFAAGGFERYDRNADQMIDESEWDASVIGIPPIHGMGQGTATGEGESDTAEAADMPEGDAGSAMVGSVAFEDYDTDSDALLSEEEYSRAQQDAFGSYDVDASGDISMEEFQSIEFGRFDMNRDGTYDETEFERYRTEGETQTDG